MASSGESSFWEQESQNQREIEAVKIKSQDIREIFQKSKSLEISDFTDMKPAKYFMQVKNDWEIIFLFELFNFSVFI